MTDRFERQYRHQPGTIASPTARIISRINVHLSRTAQRAACRRRIRVYTYGIEARVYTHDKLGRAITIRRSRLARQSRPCPHHQKAQPATCTMRSGRPSFIAPPVKSNKALEDIRNLLAGTCPAPPTDEVTAANVGSRSNAFAAAEGAPTNPILTLHRACCPCCPSPSPSDGLVSRLLAARRGPSESYAPYASPAHSRPAAVRTMAMLTMAMVTMQTSRSARPRSCTTPRRRCSWRPPCRVRRGATSPRPERSPCTPAPRRAALTLALAPSP